MEPAHIAEPEPETATQIAPDTPAVTLDGQISTVLGVAELWKSQMGLGSGPAPDKNAYSPQQKAITASEVREKTLEMQERARDQAILDQYLRPNATPLRQSAPIHRALPPYRAPPVPFSPHTPSTPSGVSDNHALAAQIAALTAAVEKLCTILGAK